MLFFDFFLHLWVQHVYFFDLIIQHLFVELVDVVVQKPIALVSVAGFPLVARHRFLVLEHFVFEFRLANLVFFNCTLFAKMKKIQVKYGSLK